MYDLLHRTQRTRTKFKNIMNSTLIIKLPVNTVFERITPIIIGNWLWSWSGNYRFWKKMILILQVYSLGHYTWYISYDTLHISNRHIPPTCNKSVHRQVLSVFKYSWHKVISETNVDICLRINGPLARYAKLRVRMRRECRERFPRHRR